MATGCTFSNFKIR